MRQSDMRQSGAIYHDLAHKLWADAQLREKFQRDPGAVLADWPLTGKQRELLLDGSFPALAELGMHPLVQVTYALARNPDFASQLTFQAYLDDLD